jgi:hypothetical protein
MSRELSDHTSLLITSGEKPRTQQKFRFENCWFERPELATVINSVWNETYNGSSNLDIWHKKFTKLRKVLKGWNINIEGKYRKYKKNLAKKDRQAGYVGGIWPFVYTGKAGENTFTTTPEGFYEGRGN